jgi:nucleotidyltransferase/DNA polymerase involved in DNA repair
VKIAHIRLQDFPIQVEIKRNSALRHKPVIVGGSPDHAGEVFACSPAAQNAGVAIGMPLRQAEQLCPNAIFLPISTDRYTKEHEALLALLSAFSPLRETISLGEVAIEASGLEGLYGSDQRLVDRIVADIREQMGFVSQIGLAANKVTAAIAATLAPLNSGEIVPIGKENDYLALLPIDVLSMSDVARELLRRLGLATLGQVAELPTGSLSRTLGKEGEELQRLCRGVDGRPLIPEFEEIPLSAQIHLEFELKHLPALVAYTDLLIAQLVRELGGFAAGALILDFELEGGKQLVSWGYLKPPSSDQKRLSDRANQLLDRIAFSAGVTSLKLSLLELRPSHEDTRQIPLRRGYALATDALRTSLKSIRERFGKDAIAAAATVNGPPPHPIEVRTTDDGFPGAMIQEGKWSHIDSIQLHWRLEGEWWWQEGRRDYYQVVTKEGDILVLLNTSPLGDWFLDQAAKPSQWPVI